MAYNGGKAGAGVYHALINMMPPHDIYVEACLGAGAIMRNKKPASVNVGIEIDDLVASSFPRMAATEILVGDAMVNLPLLGLRKGALVYCDPPYVRSTRSYQGRIYKHDMTDADHVRLLGVLKRLVDRGVYVMISGYDNDLYRETLADWRVETFANTNHRGAVTKECVWLSFPKPSELHDYRYLGRNFHDRARIKKKAARWIEKLRNMPDVERYAIMEAVNSMRQPASSEV